MDNDDLEVLINLSIASGLSMNIISSIASSKVGQVVLLSSRTRESFGWLIDVHFRLQIMQFLCMSALDLGIATCSKESLTVHCLKMTAEVCETETNFMGGLIPKFKKVYQERRIRAQNSLEKCKK